MLVRAERGAAVLVYLLFTLDSRDLGLEGDRFVVGPFGFELREFRGFLALVYVVFDLQNVQVSLEFPHFIFESLVFDF